MMTPAQSQGRPVTHTQVTTSDCVQSSVLREFTSGGQFMGSIFTSSKYAVPRPVRAKVRLILPSAGIWR